MTYYHRVGGGIAVGRSQDSGVDVAYLPSGRFVMVWTDSDRGSGDADGTGIRARLFEADGTPVGDEFRVNATTLSSQQEAAVEWLTTGGFVVTWSDSSGLGGDPTRSIKAQIFDAAGLPAGAEFLVNTATNLAQFKPVVARLPDGGFVISWNDTSGDVANTGSVKAQRFDAAGARIGTEILVNTNTAGQQFETSAAAQSDGRFMIVWTDRSSSYGDVRGQLFAADGTKLGSEFGAMSAPVIEETKASVTALAGGGYFVVWQEGGNTGRVAGQRYDSDGQAVGGRVLLSPNGTGANSPVVEALSDGGFVVSYRTVGFDEFGRVLAERQAQVYDAAGAPQGSPVTLQVATEDNANLIDRITLAADSNGGFVAAWSFLNAGSSMIDAFRYAPGDGSVGTIGIDSTGLSEALAENVAVATFWTEGVANSPVAYAIEGDTSGGAFRIDGDRLILDDRSRLDFESAPTVTVTVRATAANGETNVRAIELQVQDSAFDGVYRPASELAVNTVSAGAQTASQVTALIGGGFVTTWVDTPVAFGTGQVKGQLYDAAGVRVGGEFVVNASGPISVSFNYAAGLSGGGFVVVWSDGNGDGAGSGVRAQLFDAAGASVGGEFQVNTATPGGQGTTTVAALSGGGFVVGWTDASQQGGDASVTSVKAQMYDADGARAGGELLVNTITTGGQNDAAFAARPEGGFVAVWTDLSRTAGDTSGSAVRAQIFGTAGEKIGSEFLVNSATSGSQSKAAVAVLADGRFMITWEMDTPAGADFDGTSIRGQIYEADGTRVGGELILNSTYPLDQEAPSIAALPQGGFVVAWRVESGDPFNPEVNVVGQIFDRDGRRVGGEFRLNADEGGDQTAVSIATLASGGFAASWTESDFNLPAEVRARVFEPAAFAPLGSEAAETLTGTAGDDVFYASGGDDVVQVQQGGDDRVHGGAGNDVIYFGAVLDADDRVSGGAGADTVVIKGQYAPIVLTAAMPGVETLRLLSAKDTIFGPASAGTFAYTITVANSAVEAGTTLAIDGSGLAATEKLDFDGSRENDGGYVVTGGKAADDLTGSQGNDVLRGGDGDDYLWGYNGNDRLEGGEGADTLSGSEGDVLYGGNGNDIITSDNVQGNVGFIAHGEGGDDRFTLRHQFGTPGTASLTGGAGRDMFEVIVTAPAAISLDGGTEADDFYFVRLTGSTAQVTMGAGSDLLRFAEVHLLLATAGVITVADFETGPGGDRIGLYESLASGDGSVWEHYDNPFAAGYARLVQDGADTLLQMDADGGGDDLTTLVRFQNRNVADFTPENTDGYVNGTGSAGRILTGVTGQNLATEGDDHLTGREGNDFLLGHGGNDVLIGLGGRDDLQDYHGADRLEGGAGDDILHAQSGSDYLSGGEGNDMLSGDGPGTTIDGGAGNDNITVSHFGDAVGTAPSSVSGGDGNDTISIYMNKPMALTFDAGAGADSVQVVQFAGPASLTLGAGADTLLLGRLHYPGTIAPGALTIADFEAGGGGDRIDFATYLATNAPNRPAGSNPFETGHLRLVQSGTSTIVEFNGGGGFVSLVTLANVERTTLTAFNLGGFTPPDDIIGTEAGDVLIGTEANETMAGRGGNDLLDGRGGADLLRGGLGDDVFIVDHAGDQAIEAADEGTDEVRTNLADHVLAQNVENLTGTSAAGQALTGNGLANLIVGGEGSDSLYGLGGDDVLVGFAGADTMRGGAGNDIYAVDAGDTVIEHDGEGNDEIRTAAASYVLGAGLENLRATSDIGHDFRGNLAPNAIIGGDGNDIIRLQDGGGDLAFGKNGVDSFYMGGAMDAYDFLDGGDNRDSLILQGSYDLTLVYAPTGKSSISNVESISLISGTGTQYGQAGTSLYSYNLTLVDDNVAAGALMKINGFNLQAGENFTLDASAETDAPLQVFAGFGVDTFTGGQQGDAFIFGHNGRFGAGDSVNGGGGYDVVYLRGDYTIDFNAAGFGNALTNVESIAILTSANNEFAGGGDGDFDYTITWADALLAAGATFTVNASRLQAHETFVFDGSQETNGVLRVFGGASADTLTGGGGADQLHGGGGADVLRGSGGADLFRYSTTGDSTAGARDTIHGFVAGTDKIDVLRIDAKPSTSEDNEAFAFIGSAAFSASGSNAPGELRAFHVSGDLWQVEGDVNGDGIADLVVDVHVEAGQPLTIADFVL